MHREQPKYNKPASVFELSCLSNLSSLQKHVFSCVTPGPLRASLVRLVFQPERNRIFVGGPVSPFTIVSMGCATFYAPSLWTFPVW